VDVSPYLLVEEDGSDQGLVGQARVDQGLGSAPGLILLVEAEDELVGLLADHGLSMPQPLIPAHKHFHIIITQQ
jgi:hypothetical protein